MVRVLGILAGILMVFVSLWSFGHGFYAYATSSHDQTVEERFHKDPRHLALASDGPFGKFDRRQVQRGFQVYTEVCSACHSLKLVAFRNLQELGYDEAEVKKIASDWKTQVADVDPKTGEPKGRKPLPADHFPPPFPNEVAARAANNNALPPDLSDITKAREGGPSYVYSLLTGFQNPPANLPAENRPGPNLHYNPYFANLNIAMPPPLTSEGQVAYKDGTKATVDQMAQDVAAFLAWSAEPRLESRHAAGSVVVIFLIVLTILAYMAKQNIWHGGASRAVRRTGVLDPENMAKRDAASAEGLDG
ncbi:MAG TPA: cytochrome c1 [Allosphingosinicella sp.]|jgi:ubiquinol-cytochrome c reductase cytochrome c1 subunit|nr:cytochrome c1 [Allosphingosinicella sp.]